MDKGNSAVCSAECILFFLENTSQLKEGAGHSGSQEEMFTYFIELSRYDGRYLNSFMLRLL